MKISNHIFFSLFIFLLFSCTQGAERKGFFAGKGKIGAQASGPEKELGVEDFDQFIQKFSTYESFQLQRIKFPINVIIPNTEHEGMAPIEETIGRYDWEILDLTYDSTYVTRPYDQYFQDVRYGKDTTVVEIRGIDNGIYADYYFALMDDKWYLVKLYEASF